MSLLKSMAVARTLVIVALLIVGCDAKSHCVVREFTGAQPTVLDDEAECTPSEAVYTRVPSEKYGTVLQMCTNCDIDTCRAFGEECDAEGAPCDDNGVPGVCRGCCDASIGVLRCARIVDPPISSQTPGNRPL
jgi:hypothetical protein